jgi:hypothetical protein
MRIYIPYLLDLMCAFFLVALVNAYCIDLERSHQVALMLIYGDHAKLRITASPFLAVKKHD